jgi:hypothetical protein
MDAHDTNDTAPGHSANSSVSASARQAAERAINEEALRLASRLDFAIAQGDDEIVFGLLPSPGLLGALKMLAEDRRVSFFLEKQVAKGDRASLELLLDAGFPSRFAFGLALRASVAPVLADRRVRPAAPLDEAGQLLLGWLLERARHSPTEGAIDNGCEPPLAALIPDCPDSALFERALATGDLFAGCDRGDALLLAGNALDRSVLSAANPVLDGSPLPAAIARFDRLLDAMRAQDKPRLFASARALCEGALASTHTPFDRVRLYGGGMLWPDCWLAIERLVVADLVPDELARAACAAALASSQQLPMTEARACLERRAIVSAITPPAAPAGADGQGAAPLKSSPRL